MKPEWPLGGDVVEGINYPSFPEKIVKVLSRC